MPDEPSREPHRDVSEIPAGEPAAGMHSTVASTSATLPPSAPTAGPGEPPRPPESGRAGSARPWHRRRWFYVVGWLSGIGAVIAVLLFVVPAQWVGRVIPGNSIVDDGAVAFKPGSASAIGDRLFLDGVESFAPDGQILFTTVAIDDDVSIAEWIESSIDDDVELRTRESVFGTRSTGEQQERNLQLMQVSKDTAVVVALEHLGIDVFDVTGVGFSETVEGEAADGVLAPGDVIVAIDGEPVTTLASLQELLGARPPGTEVVITVESIETSVSRDEELTLGVHPDNDGGFIGIGGVQERLEELDLPFDVDIDSGRVGGPSAGLAFTLSILDTLTPGELTGGSDVAVTGTIALDGSIGNVGGVRQKARAADESGADLFIVPEASEAAAIAGAGDMPVVAVATLDEALDALAGFGGNVTELALPGDSPVG